MAVSLLKDWQGPDRYGEDVLLWKFDWRDKLVMRWIENLPKIGLKDTLANIDRQGAVHTGALRRSMAWKTWAASGGDMQVFEAKYLLYAKFIELAVGKGEPFSELPPGISGPRWKPISMPGGRKRKARPHVATEMRSQARKFSTALRRHFSFVGLTYMAYAMGDDKAAAEAVNNIMMERDTGDRAF